jgi:hypothetical protein
LTFDLYVWHAPRDLDGDAAAALVTSWQEAGGDPAASPFEPSTDVGWFHRELLGDVPGIEVSSDAGPSDSTGPIWLAATDEPPARVVGLTIPTLGAPEVLQSIYGLAAKYDLIVFDPRNRRVHVPLEEMAAHASATFWPGGAIQAAVAGGAGLVMAVAAWVLSIPVLSGIAILVGGFLFFGAVYTFVHEGRKTIARKGTPSPPPG